MNHGIPDCGREHPAELLKIGFLKDIDSGMERMTHMMSLQYPGTYTVFFFLFMAATIPDATAAGFREQRPFFQSELSWGYPPFQV